MVFVVTGYLSLAQTKEAFPLRVGAAKIDITPKDQPTAPATGKYDHERTFIRAIVLDNNTTRAALISIEGFLDVPGWAESLRQIAAELQCPVENIIISATHSHSTGMPPRPPVGLSGGQTIQPLSAYVGSIMFVTLANGGIGQSPGYVANDDAFGQETFQLLNMRVKEGCAERAIVNGLTDMVTEYLKK